MATEHCTEDWNACFMDVGLFSDLNKVSQIYNALVRNI